MKVYARRLEEPYVSTSGRCSVMARCRLSAA